MNVNIRHFFVCMFNLYEALVRLGILYYQPRSIDLSQVLSKNERSIQKAEGAFQASSTFSVFHRRGKVGKC